MMEINSSEKADELNETSAAPNQNDSDGLSNSALVTRSVYGGVLMGLANLVPGISGGTMLLAAGIYPRFINAIADITRFRFRFQSLVVLGSVVAAAGIAILLFAGLLKDLVVEQRWVMYSLFIGLTLGGVPLVYKMVKPLSGKSTVAAIVAFAAMVGLALMQQYGIAGSGSKSFLMMVISGLAGASAMILPGVSGGYLLLLLGQYVPILGGIDQLKEALKARDFSAALEPGISVVLPVGIGVVLGVVVVGNLLKWLLETHREPTLGALLGLLLGSTIGLWPFQVGVAPEVGDTIKGSVVTEESIAEIDAEDWKTEFFAPTGSQIGISIALVLLGLGVTVGVSKLSGEE
jgi:putative membrane protein